MRTFKKERSWPDGKTETVLRVSGCNEKMCRKCKEFSTNFFVKLGTPDGYSFYCKTCDYKMMNAARFWRTYKITMERFEEIKSAQNNQCKICNETLTPKNLVVDHCHKAFEFRGILCRCCNSVLGYAKDNPSILQSAITYLENFRAA